MVYVPLQPPRKLGNGGCGTDVVAGCGELGDGLVGELLPQLAVPNCRIRTAASNSQVCP